MASSPSLTEHAARNALAHHVENPFWVLELPTNAGGAAVERQGQKLLAMLGAGLAEATRYPTPFGPRIRTAELIRAAVAHLRDPRSRLACEFWAAAWRRDE